MVGLAQGENIGTAMLGGMVAGDVVGQAATNVTAGTISGGRSVIKAANQIRDPESKNGEKEMMKSIKAFENQYSGMSGSEKATNKVYQEKLKEVNKAISASAGFDTQVYKNALAGRGNIKAGEAKRVKDLQSKLDKKYDVGK